MKTDDCDETFSPVGQCDVRTAFSNGDIDAEIYMTQSQAIDQALFVASRNLCSASNNRYAAGTTISFLHGEKRIYALNSKPMHLLYSAD